MGGRGSEACGVTFSADEKAKSSAVMESTTDGATFKDYTYAVIAENYMNYSPDTNHIPQSSYNLAYARVKLIFYSDLNGVKLPEFVYTVPQGSGINAADKKYFFFGCIRPNVIHLTTIDTRGAGFYSLSDHVRGTDKRITDPTLCPSLLNAVPAI